MSDKISDIQVDATVPETNLVHVETTEGGFVQSIIKKISDNKMYIYIGIAVIVLGVVLYYFFMKNQKETMAQTDKKPQLALPKQNNQPQGQAPVATEAPGPFNTMGGQEYFVLDNNGNPVKVSGSFPMVNNPLQPLPLPNQQPSQQEIMMLQKQMMEKKMMEAQMREQQMMEAQMREQQMREAQAFAQAQTQAQAKSKIKLEHPSNEDGDEEHDDDVGIELARIRANEDENVAEHNLTASELAEINKKLEMMNANNNN